MKFAKILYLIFLAYPLILSAQIYMVKVDRSGFRGNLVELNATQDVKIQSSDKSLADVNIDKNIFVAYVKEGDWTEIKSIPATLDTCMEHNKKYKYSQNDMEFEDIAAKVLITKSKIDPNSVVIQMDLTEKNNVGFIKDGDALTPVYSTQRIVVADKVELGKATAVFTEEKMRAVSNVVPIWGDIPFIGKFFKSRGASRQIKYIVATVSEIGTVDNKSPEQQTASDYSASSSVW